MVLESTKLERLRVIRDAKFVDRFEAAHATLTLSPGVDESVTGGAAPSSTIVLTPGVSDSTSVQRTGRVIDDFEDADLAEYSGDTAAVQIQGNIKDEGTYALATPESDTFIYSLDDNVGEDLPIYPQQGDIFETQMYVTGFGNDPFFAFGVQDSNNCYLVRCEPAIDEFELVRFETGSETQIASADVTIPEGEWLRAEIEWASGGTIIATLFDSTDTQLASISAKDNLWASGGVGFGDADNLGA